MIPEHQQREDILRAVGRYHYGSAGRLYVSSLPSFACGKIERGVRIDLRFEDGYIQLRTDQRPLACRLYRKPHGKFRLKLVCRLHALINVSYRGERELLSCFWNTDYNLHYQLVPEHKKHVHVRRRNHLHGVRHDLSFLQSTG